MSQLILRRKAGQEVPQEFIGIALKQCPKVFGGTVVADGKLELIHGENCTIEQVQETFANFQNEDVTLYFADAKGGSQLNDVSPFPLIVNDDEEPLLAILLDGNFPQFEKTGSSFSPSYHLAIELTNIFGDAFEMVDKNLDKLMEQIGKDHFKKKMNLNSVSRGYITVVALNGKSITFSQGDTDSGDRFPWGWVSNTFGYGAKEEAPPAETPPKKKGMFPSRSTIREKVDHKPSNNVVAAEADKTAATDTAIPAKAAGTAVPSVPPPPKPVVLTLENISVKKVKIPSHLSRKLRKNWIKERIGHVPPTVDQIGTEYEVYTSPNGTALLKKDIEKALGMSAAKLQELENPRGGKNSEPDHIDTDRQVSRNPLPILSPNSRERLKGFISDERIRKIIGENAELITAPDSVQGHEGLIPKFPQQMGLKDMADFDALPFSELQKIAHASFHDICVMAWNWKIRALSAELKVKKLKPKGEQAQVEEHVIAKEELKPEKKQGMFPSRKVA